MTTFTKGLGPHLISRGIRVNAIAPGPVWTPLIQQSYPPEQVLPLVQQQLSCASCSFGCSLSSVTALPVVLMHGTCMNSSLMLYMRDNLLARALWYYCVLGHSCIVGAKSWSDSLSKHAGCSVWDRYTHRAARAAQGVWPSGCLPGNRGRLQLCCGSYCWCYRRRAHQLIHMQGRAQFAYIIAIYIH